MYLLPVTPEHTEAGPDTVGTGEEITVTAFAVESTAEQPATEV